MFKALVEWFKAENLLVQANDEVIKMLKMDMGLYEDAVKMIWTGEGTTLEEIRERDREINHLVRDVRKKVLTHLAFSGSGSLDQALVLISIVVYIERIGDHTKDIGYLASDYPGDFKAGKLEEQLKKFETRLKERLQILIDIFENGDDVRDKARGLTKSHSDVDDQYREMLNRLMSDEDLDLSVRQAVKLSLYMRYLRRIEGHIFNSASAEANPFHRIGFTGKRKKKRES